MMKNKGNSILVKVNGKTYSTKCLLEAVLLNDAENNKQLHNKSNYGVMRNLIDIMPWESAFSYVKKFVSNLSPSKALYITDPYLFAPSVLGNNIYVNSLYSLFENNSFCDVYFITPTDSYHYSSAIFDNLKQRMQLKSYQVHLISSKKIHDRYWISSDKGAFTIGSSLNGIGKKICTIQNLEQIDYENILVLVKAVVRDEAN